MLPSVRCTQADDTIVAVASPPGRAARGVVRLSGARAHELVGRVFEGSPSEERVAPGELVLPGWPRVRATRLSFKKPRSYTGEDACELHVPGAPPLLRALVERLAELGARPASPGEFTRRAFLSGRIDLAQAEAVLALTNAEVDATARAAARALGGGLARAISSTKERALHALAHLEATIDFPEEDLPGLDSGDAIAARCDEAARELEALLGRSIRSTPSRAEPVVVLAGAANAGKSTLLNALAGRAAAIVSPIAGTTRDPVSVEVEVAAGVRVRLVDTAGAKLAEGAIEDEALVRSKEATEAADLVLRIVDLSSEEIPSGRDPAGALLVGNKCDLARREGLDVLVSGKTGEGLDELRAAIARRLEKAVLEPELVQTERQARLVAGARDAARRAASLLRSSEPARFELAAVDLREVLANLGELTGAVATDDLLDRIFGEFCIGK